MGMLMRRHYDNSFSMAASGADNAPSKPTYTEKVIPEITENEPAEIKLTKSDIMKMNVARVRAYAESQGVEGANAMSGAELKRILGNKMFEESE